MKIGILLTNPDRSDFALRYPNDGEKVAQKLSLIRPTWEFEVVAAMQRTLPASVGAYDAYILTGSPSSVNDNEPWIAQLESFVRQAYTARVPMVGLCFGHQLLAKALGGRVGRPATDQNFGWGLGMAATNICLPLPFMTPYKACVDLLSAHKEQVLDLPPNTQVLGTNDFCKYACLLIGNTVLTTQYHPEMSLAFLRDLLGELEGTLAQELIASTREELNLGPPDDSMVFMTWIANFIEQGHA